ncbi:AN1-type zinc finger protein 1 [Frankliniella fusca]|uniref:AN1-type zinc finger protein 1 n=1 Tax=Frankliniella fusca TaxID=407009 RepID=A0AAE1HNA3_9NEOP|nr:AN1-type zinc finger protein 1 [Frankliniella fusca]
MELPKLGERCFVTSCSQLDFLPIKCAHCSQTFCKDHSFPLGHGCTGMLDKSISDDQAVATIESYACSYEACEERNVVELLCTYCKKNFCVSHRHHGCMDPRREAQRARRERFEAPKRQFNQAKEAVNKMLDEKIEKNRALSGTKKDTANKIQLMRIKQKATGRKNVPISSRTYFLAHWIPNEGAEPQSKAVFVNKEWALGRVVDEIGDQCKIITDKNPSSPKLRLFHMNGEILSEDMSIQLQKLLEDEITIDGASLIIDFHSETTVDSTNSGDK